MRVGIDICRLTDPMTGVGNYIRNLVLGLAAVDQRNQYVLYPYFDTCFPKRYKELAEFLPDQINFTLHGIDKNELLVKLMWCKLKLPKESQLASVDVTHSTNIAGPRLRKSKLVVTVHDCSFIREPAWHKAGNLEYSNRALNQTVKRADLIITPSKYSADELVEFHPQTKDRVRVTAEAVHESFQPPGPGFDPWVIKSKYELARPYLLYVGTLEPRKNLVGLIKAYQRLLLEGECPCDLVLAGGRGWKAEPIIDAIKQPENQGRLHWLGYVPGEDLAPLYQAAHAAVYPSLYEGFGLPILEAMSCGAPVLTSPLTSLPEVGGDAVLYADPYDEQDLAQAMKRIMTDSALCGELRTQGLKRAGLFSRKRMGEETLAVYRELAG